jgi:hypothetical protein
LIISGKITQNKMTGREFTDVALAKAGAASPNSFNSFMIPAGDLRAPAMSPPPAAVFAAAANLFPADDDDEDADVDDKQPTKPVQPPPPPQQQQQQQKPPVQVSAPTQLRQPPPPPQKPLAMSTAKFVPLTTTTTMPKTPYEDLVNSARSKIKPEHMNTFLAVSASLSTLPDGLATLQGMLKVWLRDGATISPQPTASVPPKSNGVDVAKKTAAPEEKKKAPKVEEQKKKGKKSDKKEKSKSKSHKNSHRRRHSHKSNGAAKYIDGEADVSGSDASSDEKSSNDASSSSDDFVVADGVDDDGAVATSETHVHRALMAHDGDADAVAAVIEKQSKRSKKKRKHSKKHATPSSSEASTSEPTKKTKKTTTTTSSSKALKSDNDVEIVVASKDAVAVDDAVPQPTTRLEVTNIVKESAPEPQPVAAPPAPIPPPPSQKPDLLLGDGTSKEEQQQRNANMFSAETTAADFTKAKLQVPLGVVAYGMGNSVAQALATKLEELESTEHAASVLSDESGARCKNTLAGHAIFTLNTGRPDLIEEARAKTAVSSSADKDLSCTVLRAAMASDKFVMAQRMANLSGVAKREMRPELVAVGSLCAMHSVGEATVELAAEDAAFALMFDAVNPARVTQSLSLMAKAGAEPPPDVEANILVDHYTLVDHSPAVSRYTLPDDSLTAWLRSSRKTALLRETSPMLTVDDDALSSKFVVSKVPRTKVKPPSIVINNQPPPPPPPAPSQPPQSVAVETVDDHHHQHHHDAVVVSMHTVAPEQHQQPSVWSSSSSLRRVGKKDASVAGSRAVFVYDATQTLAAIGGGWTLVPNGAMMKLLSLMFNDLRRPEAVMQEFVTLRTTQQRGVLHPGGTQTNDSVPMMARLFSVCIDGRTPVHADQSGKMSYHDRILIDTQYLLELYLGKERDERLAEAYAWDIVVAHLLFSFLRLDPRLHQQWYDTAFHPAGRIVSPATPTVNAAHGEAIVLGVNELPTAVSMRCSLNVEQLLKKMWVRWLTHLGLPAANGNALSAADVASIPDRARAATYGAKQWLVDIFTGALKSPSAEEIKVAASTMVPIMWALFPTPYFGEPAFSVPI